VVRLCFLYYVVVGRMMFENIVVFVIWKLSVSSRLSLFLGVLLCYLILCGCRLGVVLCVCIEELVSSRCLRKYLLFLVDESSRLVC